MTAAMKFAKLTIKKVRPNRSMETSVRKVLDVRPYRDSSKESEILHSVSGFYHREVHALGTENTWLTLLRSFFMPRRLSKYGIIITHEYFSSFGVSLRLLLTFCRTKHVTIGLNQSRRLLKTRVQAVDRQINRVFGRCNLIIVHSRREMTLFNTLHSIPMNRFHFSLWGFDLPRITPAKFSSWDRPYVCLVGRNNRDIDLFVKALEGMPIDGILITSKREYVPEELPRNIHVFRDLPQNDTLDCIKNARANLILVKDDDRGAGHITAVAAMFAGTPQIFSDVEVLRDYLVDGVSATEIPLGDAYALRAAIEKMLANPTLASALSENAKSYAERWLTNEAASGRVVFALDQLRQNVRLPTVDPKWLEAFELFRSRQVGVHGTAAIPGKGSN
jgi:glycosyltransferase involved in cell wall biosynthesis